MPRRGNQKGTNLEDVGDAWRIRYRLRAVDEKGQIRETRPTEYFYKRDYPTKELAQRAAADFMKGINEANAQPRQQTSSPSPRSDTLARQSEDGPSQRSETFAQLVAKWQAMIMGQGKESSQSTWKSKLRCHLLPTFGKVRLTDITTEILQAWISSRTNSAEHTWGQVRLMRKIWRCGMNWGYAQHYPFKGLHLPRREHGKSYAFSVDETLAILGELAKLPQEEHWKYVFVLTLVESGIRPGECAGLRRADAGPRYLSICQNVWNCKIQTPKTATAYRKVAISTMLAEQLRQHMECTSTNRLDLLFATRNGRPMSTHAFMERTLRPILKKLGIKPDKRAGLYAFRHGNLTLMDQLQIPLRTRQERAGHSDPKVTLAYYTHPITAENFAAAEKIGALLSPKGDTRDYAGPVTAVTKQKDDDGSTPSPDLLRSIARSLQMLAETNSAVLEELRSLHRARQS